MKRKQWEYLTVLILNNQIYLQEELNKYGKEGWECVNIHYNKFIGGQPGTPSYEVTFKRQKI